MTTAENTFFQRLKLFAALDLPLIGHRFRNLLDTSPSVGQDVLSFPMGERAGKTIGQLINKSHERPLDVNGALPWDIGVDRSRPPKRMDQLWIAGTPYAEGLTAEQRLETAWIETARDVSMFINLEEFLPPLYVGYVNRYGKSLPRPVYEYLMIFAKEEIVHTLMFRRYMQLASLPLFRPPAAYAKLVALLPELHPCQGILATLVVEWTAELGAMNASQSDEVDPLTREMFKQHHHDEVRHIAFACRVVEEYFDDASSKERAKIRRMFRQLIPKVLTAFRYNPEIAEHTSFDFPIAPDDFSAIQSVRTSVHNERLDAVRFREMTNWFIKMGLLT